MHARERKDAQPPEGLRATENKLWDVEAGRVIGSLPDGYPVIRRGALLVTSPNGHKLHVCDTDTGRERVVLSGRFPYQDRLVVSPDGKRLISGTTPRAFNDSAPVVWDLTTGKELFRLEGHEPGQLSGAFSPDGRRIVSAGARGSGRAQVKVWDASGRELLSESVAGQVRAALDLVAFSADGHQLTMRPSAIAGGGARVVVLDGTPRPETK